MLKAIINGKVFTGEELLSNYAILFEKNRVVDVILQRDLPNDCEISYDLKGNYIAPGFIDLQVNGGGGVLFNNAPTVETLQVMAAAHRQYGTTGFLPTLITDSFEVMRAAIAAVAKAMEIGLPGILGIHLEGPFLNAERKGAHDASKFCILDQQGFDIITSLGAGKTLVTIAPELTTVEMIRRITEAGPIVSMGHSAADYNAAKSALMAGATGFTHLYNAMTPLQSRSPGMVGAALQDRHSWFGIIADGYHMHPAAFSVALAAKQVGGAILVTDAMPTVGAKNKSFVLNGETIVAREGRCANAAGSLAGSDLNMNSAVKNAAQYGNIDIFEAIRMASLYPAKALGLESELGCIKSGSIANFVSMDQDFCVCDTWINGDKKQA